MVSCGVGCKGGSNPALLWSRPAAAAGIGLSLGTSISCTRQKKKRKKRKEKRNKQTNKLGFLLGRKGASKGVGGLRNSMFSMSCAFPCQSGSGLVCDTKS